MVVDDLVRHLTSTYRIDDNVRRRAIAGVSMGGYGALKIALKHHDKFGAVSAHSAALLPADPKAVTESLPQLKGRAKQLLAGVFGDPLDKKRYAAENVFALVGKARPEAFGGLAIRFDCGGSDRWGFDKTNLLLHKKLEAKKIPHVWKHIPQGGHGWRSGYNQKALPGALAFLGEHFAKTEALEGMKSGLGGLGGDDKNDKNR